MIPIEREVEVIKSGKPLQTFKMEVSKNNYHLLIPLLRDSLYSDKTLAPIREYSTNAVDSHIHSGIAERPILVTLPTHLDPEFRVRDFGAGLDIEELKNTYFIYLESTKRGNNDENGMLGLGSKSAFAYSDLFVVTSIKNGRKRIITCPVSGEPTLDYDDVTTDESGVEITIPVKLVDIDNFVKTALDFYKFWKVRPIFHNIGESKLKSAFEDVDRPAVFTGKQWTIRPRGYQSAVICGNIPYPINWHLVQSNLPSDVNVKLGTIFSFLSSNTVELRVPIGQLEFTPNRESLQYTETTIKSLIIILTEIHNTIFDLITERIAKATNLWEAMIIYNNLFHGANVGSDIDKDEIFTGDMTAINNMLKGKLKWNKHVISSGKFSNMHHWDVDSGWVDDSHSNWNYKTGANKKAFAFYTKSSEGDKLVNCTRPTKWANNDIVPSKTSVVVFHNTENGYYNTAAARYILWEQNPEIDKVYLLSFSSEKNKKEFIEKYDFKSVPYIDTADIEDEVKEFLRDNRVTGEGPAPITIPIMSLSGMKVSNSRYTNSFYWKRETVKLKDLTSGIFVIHDKGSIIVNGHKIEEYNLPEFWQSLVNFCHVTGRNIDKIYGIQRRTAKSVWFSKQLVKGTWKGVEQVVNEELAKRDVDVIKKANLFFEQVSQIGSFIGANLAAQLVPIIKIEDSPMMKYCNIVSQDIRECKVFNDVIKRIGLKGYTFDEKEKAPFDIKKMTEKLTKTYPLLFSLDYENIKSSGEGDKTEKMDDEEIKNIADYVNAIDFYRSQKALTT